MMATASSQTYNTKDDVDIVNLISSTQALAYTILHTTVPAFEYHTQRLSNMQGIGSDVTSPHYQTAIGYGKILTFITNKTDGVQNNSVVLGNFGKQEHPFSCPGNSQLTCWLKSSPKINVCRRLGKHEKLPLKSANTLIRGWLTKTLELL